MAIIKCKMCGGDLDISEGLSVCECEYCGTKQTVPSADNEKKLTLFARAGRLRAANEFDKAAGIYETIVADFPEEAEAYWGLVLCRYGIEYVDDPATGKKIPTCHRVSFDSVLEDGDFEQACENADAVARRQYREEAKQIEDIRRGIIEISGKEEPYDIFICYKETDENGNRTIDSVLAQDVYDALTERGYRVFFSRISLEDKLGTEYEPYIFAALNSAKIMLAFGTDFEYYNAVWVKNEWSRFLKLMAKDKTKHLIPCYKNLDPDDDMPEKFRRLQGQDLGKVGAIQDLLRGIEKIMPRKGEAVQTSVQQVVQGGGPNVTALMQRGQLALEDGDWDRAREFYDQVLSMDAQNAEAYLGLALAKLRLHSEAEIAALDQANRITALESNADYRKFLRFSPEERKTALDTPLAQAKVAAAERQRREAEERAERERREAEARAERERREAEERAERERREAEEQRVRMKKLEQKKKELTVVRERIRPCQGMIAAGGRHTVGLRSDGTVLSAGDNGSGQCDVSGWKDIKAIAAGSSHTVGLRSDGTVLASGSNTYGQCNTDEWRDIMTVAAGDWHTVGLKSDGTVVATKMIESDAVKDYGQCDVIGWTEIVAIAAGDEHTVGLRSDGKVLAVGNQSFDQCNVSEWTEIVAIAAGTHHTVGVRSDGTVLTAGLDQKNRLEISEWKDIIAADGRRHDVFLRSDGTAEAVGYNDSRCNVSGWTEVVAIAAGFHHTVGLRSNGTLLSTKISDDLLVKDYGQSTVSEWKLFDSIDTLERERKESVERAQRAEQERKEAAVRAERERREAAVRAERERREAAERAEQARQAKFAALTSEKTSLQTELSSLKGLFSGKRRKEIEARLTEIEAELKKL